MTDTPKLSEILSPEGMEQIIVFQNRQLGLLLDFLQVPENERGGTPFDQEAMVKRAIRKRREEHRKTVKEIADIKAWIDRSHVDNVKDAFMSSGYFKTENK